MICSDSGIRFARRTIQQNTAQAHQARPASKNETRIAAGSFLQVDNSGSLKSNISAKYSRLSLLNECFHARLHP